MYRVFHYDLPKKIAQCSCYVDILEGQLTRNNPCVSVLNLQNLRIISCDLACFSVFKTLQHLKLFNSSPEKIASD